MYPNNIDLSLTFLGFFLITNVFGAPGTSSLAKNQTSDKIKGKIGNIFSQRLPQFRKKMNKIFTENDTIALGYGRSIDDPTFGKLENLLLMIFPLHQLKPKIKTQKLKPKIILLFLDFFLENLYYYFGFF